MLHLHVAAWHLYKDKQNLIKWVFSVYCSYLRILGIWHCQSWADFCCLLFLCNKFSIIFPAMFNCRLTKVSNPLTHIYSSERQVMSEIRRAGSQHIPLESWLSRPGSPSELPAHQTPLPDPRPWVHSSPGSPTEHKQSPNNQNQARRYEQWTWINQQSKVSWGMNRALTLRINLLHFLTSQQLLGQNAIIHPPIEEITFFSITQKVHWYVEAAAMRLLTDQKKALGTKRCQNKPSNKESAERKQLESWKKNLKDEPWMNTKLIMTIY